MPGRPRVFPEAFAAAARLARPHDSLSPSRSIYHEALSSSRFYLELAFIGTKRSRRRSCRIEMKLTRPRAHRHDVSQREAKVFVDRDGLIMTIFLFFLIVIVDSAQFT